MTPGGLSALPLSQDARRVVRSALFGHLHGHMSADVASAGYSIKANCFSCNLKNPQEHFKSCQERPTSNFKAFIDTTVTLLI